MRISLRHLTAARLMLLLAVAMSMLPGTALARGVSKPSRSFSKQARATVKPKEKKPVAQRVVLEQAPARRGKRKPARKAAKPVGAATSEGSKPAMSRARVGFAALEALDREEPAVLRAAAFRAVDEAAA